MKIELRPVRERPVGELLRHWRQRRRLSQLALAGDADVSTRHLSCVETGRALPSREMLLRLADRLDVPLRDRNRLMTAAGYAPIYRERPLDDPELAAARAAVTLLLDSHMPYPALAVDRHWTMLANNAAVLPLVADVDAALLAPPVNVLRLSLHPQGLAPRIVNLPQWRAHLVARLQRQIAVSGDAALAALLDELLGYPAPDDGADAHPPPGTGVVVPLQLASPAGVLSFLSTTTVFGTPVDITLSELALETFFPADAATGEALRRIAAG